MPTEPHALVRGRYLDAFRAVALHPRGMRLGSYPTAMPMLLELGYVERRPSRYRRGRVHWYMTPAGRDLLAALEEKPRCEG